MAQRSFELSGELSARLDEVAADTGQSADEIVRAALERWLEQIEDERNDGLLEQIAERLQDVDYAATAEAAIEGIAASESRADPLEAITSKRPERSADVQLQDWDMDVAASLLQILFPTARGRRELIHKLRLELSKKLDQSGAL